MSWLPTWQAEQILKKMTYTDYEYVNIDINPEELADRIIALIDKSKGV